MWDDISALLPAAEAQGPTYEKRTMDSERTFYGIDYMTICYWLLDSFKKGIEFTGKQMNGQVPRRSMEELNTLTTKRIMKSR